MTTVSLFGDSIMQSCDARFTEFYGARGIGIAERNYFGGTAACDWFDAASHMTGSLAVVCFSGNMLTPCTQNRGWQLEVTAHDLEHLGAIFAFTGKPALWIGGVGDVGQLENENWRLGMAKAVAAKYAAQGQRYSNAAYALTTPAFDPSERFYQSWLPCQPQDNANGWCWMGVAAIRESDGYHLTAAGQYRFAKAVVDAT